MTDHNNDVVLILNARKWGRGDYAIITGMSLFFAAFGLALPYSRITNGPPITRGDVAAFVAFEALILPFWPVLALFCHWMTPRIVRVDDQELAVTTARGRSKCMHWKEIERVFWNSQGLVLRSATTSVGIGWSDFDESARRLTGETGSHPLVRLRPDLGPASAPTRRHRAALVAKHLEGRPRGDARTCAVGGLLPTGLLGGEARSVERLQSCGNPVGRSDLRLLAWAILGAHHESKINPRWRTRRVKAPIAEL